MCLDMVAIIDTTSLDMAAMSSIVLAKPRQDHQGCILMMMTLRFLPLGGEWGRCGEGRR